MKKIFLVSALILVVLMSTVAFAAEVPSNFRWDLPIFPNVKPEYVMKIGYLDAPDAWLQGEHGMATVFKNLVERGTQGKVLVELYPSAQLGKEATMAQMLRSGAAMQGAFLSEGIIPTFYPQIQCLSIPWLFKNELIAYRVLDGQFGKELAADMLAKTGVRIIGIGENGGFRHITNSRRPIHKPEDMKGLKIRTMEHAGHMAIMNSLGAIATPMPWSDLYTSLQTKVVDGQENSLSLINNGKLYEVQNYLTLDGHVYSIDFVLVNENWLKKLPKEYQLIIRNAGEQAAIHERGINKLTEWEHLTVIQQSKHFKEVYLMSAEEKAAFAEIAQPAYLEWYKKTVDPKGIWSGKVLEAVKEAETYYSKIH